MSMRTLLWKDFHQNRKILLGVGIIIAMPYCIALCYPLFSRYSFSQSLASRIAGAAQYAIFLSAGMAAFIAGNAIAGERADRSAEFAAYLPIRRRDGLISKALLAATAVAGMFVLHVGFLMAPQMFSPRISLHLFLGTENTIRSVLFLFGVAWLLSSTTSSPAMSAAAALGSLFLLAFTLEMIDANVRGLFVPHPSAFDYYPTICITVGAAAFLAGSVYYVAGKKP